MTVYSQIQAATATHAFVMQGQTLAKGLTAIKAGINRRMTLPIFAYVRMIGDANGLHLTTTNLDQVYTHTIPLDGLPTFTRCVPFAELLHLTKAKAKAAIIFDVSAGFTLDGIALPTLPADDFPTLGLGIAAPHIAISGKAFAPLLNAMSQEDTRYYLNGVFIHGVRTCEDGPVNTVLVATDGHRLTKQETPIVWPADIAAMTESGFILPSAFVAEVAKHDMGELAFTVRNRQAYAIFTAGQIRIETVTIDGSFPAYERVIPQSPEICAMVQKDLLTSGLKIMKALKTEHKYLLKLTFEGQRLTLTINGQSHAIANAPHDSDYFEIGMNGDYLADLCADHDGDTLTFEFSDNWGPALIRNGLRTFVLMPYRL